jgi:hypothetical protein
MSLAIAEAQGPLAGLGGQVVASADMARLLGDARRAVESASLAALRQLLAEAEAMPVLTNGAEPPGNAVIVADVLACLVYAMKTMVEPDPALWSGYCVQRAFDCLFFASEVLDHQRAAAGLIRGLDAWLEGDGGDRLRREGSSFVVLAAQLRQLSDGG